MPEEQYVLLENLVTTVQDALDVETLKAGRVLSARNLERLKAALDTLTEILLAAEPEEDDEEEEPVPEDVERQQQGGERHGADAGAEGDHRHQVPHLRHIRLGDLAKLVGGDDILDAGGETLLVNREGGRVGRGQSVQQAADARAAFNKAKAKAKNAAAKKQLAELEKQAESLDGTTGNPCTSAAALSW